jgi:hypothetical protein
MQKIGLISQIKTGIPLIKPTSIKISLGPFRLIHFLLASIFRADVNDTDIANIRTSFWVSANLQPITRFTESQLRFQNGDCSIMEEIIERNLY